MRWIEKLISWVSPETAVARTAWMQELRNYDAARTDRFGSGWRARNSPGETTDSGYRDTVRARARDMERNSDITNALIGASVRNIVGTGIRVQVKINKRDGTEDTVTSKFVASEFERWCNARNCDVGKRVDFKQMQKMAVRRMKVDGELIFIKLYDGAGRVPFRLQMSEADNLDTFLYEWQGNKVYSGVEVDAYNAPVAYHFRMYDLWGMQTGKTQRIPAEKIIHLFDPRRPTQVRGVSELASSLPRLRDIDSYLEAESVKARIAACLGVFIRKQIPGNLNALGRQSTDEATGNVQEKLSPGMIMRLQPGDDISVVSPGGVPTTLTDFTRTQQRLAGSGQGLSYEATSRDYSQTNYSSARQGLLEDQKTYGDAQDYLVEHFCKEIYTEWFISAVLAGVLDTVIRPAEFWRDKDRFLNHGWITPGWAWIDPLKEVKANEAALGLGLDTRTRIAASQGREFEDDVRQLSKEKKLMQELGIWVEPAKEVANNDQAQDDGTADGSGDGATGQGT